MRTHPFRLIFALGFLFGIGLILFEAFRFAQFSSSAAQPGSAATAIVEIKKGEGPTEIAKQLASQGVISDARQFVWLGRLLREWKKVKAGEYQVSPGMTPMQLLDTITSGISINHPVTVREGENMYEIAQDIEAKGLATKSRFISLCRDPRFIASLGFQEPVPPTLEGYLYPETYFFNRTLASEDMIRQMVKKFLALWDSSRQSRAVSMGMTRHQIITMASIIEKETGAPQERPMISSVFYNRLKKKMRLQSDPTTIYGMWGRYKGNIHKQDLAEQNEYNTYMIPGLPIGPIGNPGKEAIEAALNPSQTEYLFFVSHNDGTHEFTRSLNDHINAVHKFQLNPKAREGKSWRDLNKKKSNHAEARP